MHDTITLNRTLNEEGQPFAVHYFGGGYTGQLTTREDAERDPMHHSYVGSLTREEFYTEVELHMNPEAECQMDRGTTWYCENFASTRIGDRLACNMCAEATEAPFDL